MVKEKQQYGTFFICDVNPVNNGEIMSALKESIESAEKENDLVFPKEKIEFIYHKINSPTFKVQHDLDLEKDYWTAAWKVKL